MAVSFPRLPRWLRGGGSSSKEREKEAISKGSSLNPSSESSSRCPPKKTKSSMRKTKRGWLNKDEERIGNDVVFPEPGGPEWSIGWVEPHGPGFKADDDDDGDNGFVVLVPCYKKVTDNSSNQFPGAINGLPSGFYPDVKVIEEWLSSLQKL